MKFKIGNLLKIKPGKLSLARAREFDGCLVIEISRRWLDSSRNWHQSDADYYQLLLSNGIIHSSHCYFFDDLAKEMK